MKEHEKYFLYVLLARVLVEYNNEIIGFGRERAADSLLFHELAFALMSIASGHTQFHYSSSKRCYGEPGHPLLPLNSIIRSGQTIRYR